MVIIRSGNPSKYDECCYGSICKSISSLTDKFEIYVQMSHDEKKPQWEKVGTFSPETYDLATEEIKRMLNVKKVT